MSIRAVTRSALLLFGAAICGMAPAAIVLPEGFQEEVVFSGLNQPTNIEFAPDGRIFVTEKSGIIKVFDSLSDPTPDVLADLSNQVHDFWDRGLLGLAVDADFPASPYIYVIYTYNFDALDPGAGMPRWPDSCPSPPGATDDGCVVNGRLSRLQVGPGNTLVGSEMVFIENRWCQQYPSHSIGDVVFDEHERVIYASAGDGASFNFADYGQGGGGSGSPVPENPCGDPDQPRGTAPSPPSAEGGALRSQDIRVGGDSVSLDGTVIALNPDTGLPLSTNPLAGGDPEDDAIIAHGLRNPLRMTMRPGTHELWIGDVGWATWEEINRIADTEDATVENFGWPCYEGAPRQGQYDGLDLDICENLYGDVTNPATAPHYAYRHSDHVDPDPNPFRCSKTGSSSIAGLAFNDGTAYPAAYDGALFFADYSRDCLFVMLADGGGLPDPATRSAFADDIANPVDIAIGPDGLLYWADFDNGRVMRINYFSTNTPPVAVMVPDVTDGPLPLNVQFDGSDSFDADPGDVITHEWDLDGDGDFDDSTAVSPSFLYTVQGQFTAALRVTDLEGDSDVAQVLITAGNTRPAVNITQPLSTLTWKVGDTISFQGEATDPEDGVLAAAALRWEIRLQHCPGGTTECHTHPIQEILASAGGSIDAPDHEWLSRIDLVLEATDSGFPGGGGGVLTGSATLTLDPQDLALTFETVPAGLDLLVGGGAQATPFNAMAIIGSSVGVVATSPQNLGGSSYSFVSWSDGGAAAHTITAPGSPATYTATFEYAGIAADWWDSLWRSRHRFSLHNLAQGETLLDFPVLVRLDPGWFDYSRTRPGGADLRFIDADGLTLLSHEITVWNPAGESLIWVKIPQVDGGSDDDFFWIYLDNPAAASAEDRHGVWSNGYAAVWHLDGDLFDSTSFDNDGTDNGSSGATGPVGGGRHFDGISAHIAVPTSGSLEITGELTLEAWVKIDDPDQARFSRILSKKNAWDDPAGYNLEYNPADNFITALSSGSNFGRAENVDLDTSWHYLAAAIQGTSATLHLDGVDVTTDGACDPLAADGQALTIGRRSGGGDHFEGALDELRISSVTRSADWVAAQYLSMSGSLVVSGAVESNCAPLDDTCDLFDDDCDGLVDEDVAPLPAMSGLQVDATNVVWSALPGAAGYRVVGGDAQVLHASAGSYATATDECLAAAETGLSVGHGPDPSAGEVRWYQVRADGCDSGTFDSAGAGQTGSRDAGIEASGVCP